MTIYETAMEWKLKLIRWEFFATLTWDPRRSPKSRRKREAQVNGWVNEIAKWGGQTKNDIAYVNRWEHGEISAPPSRAHTSRAFSSLSASD